jgi:hypothetical protein
MNLLTERSVVAVISASSTIVRNYNHPTVECLERLHNAGVKKTYWTEAGTGAAPESGLDVTGSNIKVEGPAGSSTFTVRYGGSRVDTYAVWGTKPPNPALAPRNPLYAWRLRLRREHQPGKLGDRKHTACG